MAQTLQPLYLLNDEPIRDYDKDGLGLQPFADVIAGGALGTPGPFTIGVFAEWGQGKSSILRLAQSRIDRANQADVVTVWFNAWRHEQEDHPVVPLIGTILDAIDLSDTSPGQAKAWKRLGHALRAVAYGLSLKLNLGAVDIALSGKDAVTREEQLRAQPGGNVAEHGLYLDAYRTLEEVARGSGSSNPPGRVIVFVDDLDRCLPDNGLRLLEGLKHVFAQPGFVFVLGVDRGVLEGYLAKRYKEDFGMADYGTRSALYLDKIVQLPLPLPSHAGRFDIFIDHLLRQNALSTEANPEMAEAIEDLRDVLGAGSRHNPRNLIRLINSLIVDQRTWVAQEKLPHLLGLCATARILRRQLGGLYRSFSGDVELCDILNRAAGDLQLAARQLEDVETGNQRGELRREVLVKLEDAGLQAVLPTVAGRTWLVEHEARLRFDQFLVQTSADSTGEASLQFRLASKAINRALNRRENTPISRLDRQSVTALRLQYTKLDDSGLAHLGGLTNLQMLDISNTAVTGTGLGHLGDSVDLATLLLNKTLTTDEGLRQLGEFANLDSLDLSDTQTTDAGLQYVGDLANLQSLRLTSNAVTGEGLKHLSGSTSLQTLDLRDTSVTGEGLEHLSGSTSLQTLRLSNTQVTDSGLRSLETLTNLRHLDLVHTEVTDAVLEHLRNLTKLETLRLMYTRITGKGLEHLGGLSKLHGLLLRNTPVTDAGLESIGKLANLQTLSLSDSGVTDLALKYIGELTKLQTLRLSGNAKVTDAGVRCLGNLTELRTLRLSNTGVTGTGLEYLAGSTNLKTLHLKSAQVTDEGLGHVGRFSRLEILRLKDASISDAGLEQLGGLTNLVTLGLAGTGITDLGLEHLGGLTSLQNLGLDGTRITDAGLKHLEKLTNLQNLDLMGTVVTKDGTRALVKRLPQLRVME